MQNFIDRLIEQIKAKDSCICVGLDPIFAQMPEHLFSQAVKAKDKTKEAMSKVILEFNKGIIDAVCDLVPVVKPQLAYYEMYGWAGIKAFEESCEYAKSKGLLVIADAKRGDIGSTAEAYASAFLGEVDLFDSKQAGFDADAITVNPYMGLDSIQPFLTTAKKYGKGVFVLVKTSNPSSGDLQDRIVDESGLKIHEIVAYLTESWGANDISELGYSYVGAVVGATYVSELKKLRKLMPSSFFLVPGYGAQGAKGADLKDAFNKDGLGALINSSRSILYAYANSKEFSAHAYAEAARTAVLEMKHDLKENCF